MKKTTSSLLNHIVKVEAENTDISKWMGKDQHFLFSISEHPLWQRLVRSVTDLYLKKIATIIETLYKKNTKKF